MVGCGMSWTTYTSTVVCEWACVWMYVWCSLPLLKHEWHADAPSSNRYHLDIAFTCPRLRPCLITSMHIVLQSRRSTARLLTYTDPSYHEPQRPSPGLQTQWCQCDRCPAAYPLADLISRSSILTSAHPHSLASACCLRLYLIPKTPTHPPLPCP